ncbi:tyrosine recombinase XerS [Sesbania bispinosa]|nr:tyrosine recombinase XerS [Sesbania bispinosa]
MPSLLYPLSFSCELIAGCAPFGPHPQSSGGCSRLDPLSPNGHRLQYRRESTIVNLKSKTKSISLLCAHRLYCIPLIASKRLKDEEK